MPGYDLCHFKRTVLTLYKHLPFHSESVLINHGAEDWWVLSICSDITGHPGRMFVSYWYELFWKTIHGLLLRFVPTTGWWMHVCLFIFWLPTESNVRKILALKELKRVLVKGVVINNCRGGPGRLFKTFCENFKPPPCPTVKFSILLPIKFKKIHALLSLFSFQLPFKQL